MSQPLIDKSIDELLDEADAKLKEAGIDPNDHPADDEEGADGGLQPQDDDTTDDDKGGESDDSGKDDDGGESDDKDDDAGAGASATDADGKKITFENAEELSKFIAEQKKTLDDPDASKKDKEEAKDAIESIKLYDDDNFKPKNWNEAFRDMVKALRPVLKQMDSQEKQSISEKLKSINDEMDKAFDEIAKTHKLPARTTPEGKEVDRQITAVGAAYGVTDYRKAHQIWSKLPKDTEITLPSGATMKVGGLNYSAKPAKKPNPSKEASRLQSVGGASGGAGGKKKTDYASIHGKSMDQLLEDELE